MEILSAAARIGIVSDLPIEWEWPTIKASGAGAVDITLRVVLGTPDKVQFIGIGSAPLQYPHRGGGVYPAEAWPGEPWIARWLDGPWVCRDADVFTVFVADEVSAHRWANRVLREIVLHRARSAGFRLVHAAAVTRDGRGALIMGPPGTGKTDTAMALARTGLAIVSVDRCLVRVVGGRGAVAFMPYGFNVSMSSLERLGISESKMRDRLDTWRFAAGKVYLPVGVAQDLGFPVTVLGEVDRIIQIGTSAVEREEPLGSALTDWMGAGGAPSPLPLDLPVLVRSQDSPQSADHHLLFGPLP